MFPEVAAAALLNTFIFGYPLPANSVDLAPARAAKSLPAHEILAQGSRVRAPSSPAPAEADAANSAARLGEMERGETFGHLLSARTAQPSRQMRREGRRHASVQPAHRGATALAETRRDESYLADLVGEIPLLERGRPDKFPIRASLTLVLAGSSTALEGCAGSIEQLLNGEAQKF